MADDDSKVEIAEAITAMPLNDQRTAYEALFFFVTETSVDEYVF
jgi:hypothetical protein